MKLRPPPAQSAPSPLANIQVETIDHLGLVAAAIESLNLVKRIDKRLPMAKDDAIKVTHGQRVKAMIINGLGYTTSPLYMTPQFFENKDVSRLIGRGVEAEHLNDFALGRTLDALYTYGTTKLFAEIAFEVGKEKGLLGESVHIDTTTLLLHGEFTQAIELAAMARQLPVEQAAKLTDVPTPARGYSKAHRHDLNQVVMSLTVTGKAAMPLWFEALPGNSNDKTNFHDSIAKFEAFKSQVALADSFLWVADSALYNQGKLQASKINWLTRIPQTKGHAKVLVDLPDEAIAWAPLGNGYKATTLSDTESGELWTLIYSEQAYKRELLTLNRKVDKAYTAAQKSLKKLCKEPFDCQQDAMKTAQKWLKTQRFHKTEFAVTRHERYNQKGKPPKDAKPDRIEYKLSGVIIDDLAVQRTYRNRLGRFILGTNDTDNVALTAQAMLSTYIEQQGVEKGFRFVKSDEFHLDGIYLKLPTRIDALMMVMTLTLMVYNSTEYQMRETMAELNVSLPNQKKKDTKTPTLRWVFQLMQGIHVLKMDGVPDSVSGMNKNKETIVRLFGEIACAIYGANP